MSKRSFLPGKEFTSLAQANQQVQRWITWVADQRIHGTVHEKPAERFKRESLRSVAGKPGYLLQESNIRKVATTAWFPLIPAVIQCPGAMEPGRRGTDCSRRMGPYLL
jgi:hypothetical protein